MIITLTPSACIRVAQFKRDHATADKDCRTRQYTVAQDLVGRDHVLSARSRQRPGF
jgi:hypothetical protein